MTVPAIILDVDGVICPVLQVGKTVEDLNGQAWGDYITNYVGPNNNLKLLTSYGMLKEIKQLDAEIVWHTDWEEMVDAIVAPRLKLEQGLERIEWSVLSPPVHSIMEYLMDHPRDFIWCYGNDVSKKQEDQLLDFVDYLDIYCLLIKCEDNIGLLPGDFEDMRNFLNNPAEFPTTENESQA